MSLPCPHESLVVEAVRFPAGPYRLEGELAYSDALPPVGAAVIAGPHPLLGGTMHNNVVRALGDGLAGQGLVTLRFNYRGVGHSEGPAVDVARHLAQFWETSQVPQDRELCDDLDGAIALARAVVAGADLPLVLIGYSFGCTLPPLARGGAEAAALVLVAPTVGTHDYEAFVGLARPLLVVASEGDFATDAGRLRAWFDRLTAPRLLVQERRDNHFFRAHEPWLVETVVSFLRSREVIPAWC